MRLWSTARAAHTAIAPAAPPGRAPRVVGEQVAEGLGEITAAAAGLIGTPAALVTIVGERLRVAGRFNTRSHGLERHECVCAHGLAASHRLLCVPDLRADARLAAMPIAQEPAAVRFYVGAAVVDADGAAFGMLCAVDQKPRAAPPPAEGRALRRLARAAAARPRARAAD